MFLKKSNQIAEITSYIKKNLRKGYTKESLRWALIDQGYSKFEVERSLKRVDEELAAEAPILKTKPEIRHEIIEPKNLSDKLIKKSFWKKIFG